jgi:hypothetical protein
VRAESSDFSTLPFTELWLLTRCALEGTPCWYALSHIVSWDGDAFFGRETWGWPTKVGEAEMTVDPLQISLFGRRLRRDFLHAVLPLELDTAGPWQDRIEVLGLQTAPKYAVPPRRLVAQPWELTIGDQRRVELAHVRLEFPNDPGPARIGFNEPWFEFAGCRLTGAVAGVGRVRRYPGRISAADTEGISDSWIRDRFDGITGQVPQKGGYLVGN